MEPRNGINIDSRAPVAGVASRGRAVTLVGRLGQRATETAPAWRACGPRETETAPAWWASGFRATETTPACGASGIRETETAPAWPQVLI